MIEDPATHDKTWQAIRHELCETLLPERGIHLKEDDLDFFLRSFTRNIAIGISIGRIVIIEDFGAFKADVAPPIACFGEDHPFNRPRNSVTFSWSDYFRYSQLGRKDLTEHKWRGKKWAPTCRTICSHLYRARQLEITEDEVDHILRALARALAARLGPDKPPVTVPFLGGFDVWHPDYIKDSSGYCHAPADFMELKFRSSLYFDLACNNFRDAYGEYHREMD